MVRMIMMTVIMMMKVSLRSGIYGPVSFKLDMLIAAAELYTFILL